MTDSGLRRRRPATTLVLLVTGLSFVPGARAAQAQTDTAPHIAVLQREYPELHDHLVRLERVHGVLFGALAREGGAVRAGSGMTPTPGFERDVVERLTAVVRRDGTAEELASEAEAGYAVLGPKGSEVIERAHAFLREVFGILADPGLVERADRRAALADAVHRYRSRPDVALPSVPKDMDILYDHPHALAFRERYPDLAGLVWAGHWLQLAATEPLTDFPGRAERAEGVDTVTNRYHAKLTYGAPPQAFPSQIPLAPAIAPGLIFASPEAAIVWDNLSMMQEVLADVLASPTVPDVPGALAFVVEEFTDPTTRTNERGDWESMALQHGIFFQGGYPLAVMNRSELNGDPHAAHRGAAGGLTPMPVPN